MCFKKRQKNLAWEGWKCDQDKKRLGAVYLNIGIFKYVFSNYTDSQITSSVCIAFFARYGWFQPNDLF